MVILKCSFEAKKGIRLMLVGDFSNCRDTSLVVKV